MGSSGGGSSSGGDSRQEIRYAPYVEEKHKSFLNAMQSYRQNLTSRDPFSSFQDLTVDDAFFGANYIITSFPSLYDMFGKFMAGLDIDALASQIFEETVNSTEANNLVSAESVLLQDEIDTKIIPPFEAGLRDINAVNASSYIIGKSTIMGDAKIKSISKFSAELKYRLVSVAHERWKTHLSWNQGVVSSYMDVMKLYFSSAMDVHQFNYAMAAKSKLWPFTVMEYERAALGAMQGARTTSGSVAGEGGSTSHLGAAASGAAAGLAMSGGNPWGAAIGGGIGLIGSFF